MANWTTPVTWSTSLALSVDRLNSHLRDNLQYLYDAISPRINLIANGSFRSWLSGASADPDGWTSAGTGKAIARDADEKVDTYSAKLTNGAGNGATLSQVLQDEFEDQLLGKTVTFAAYVKASTASRVRLVIEDGTNTYNSDYHTGGGAYEWVHVSGAIDSGATSITVKLEIVAGAAISAYLDGALFCEAAHANFFVRSPMDVMPILLHYQDTTPANHEIVGGFLKMQIGESPSSTGDIAVTFPEAFAATPLMVLITDSYRNARSVENVSTTGFTSKRVAGDSSSGCYWMAIGEW